MDMDTETIYDFVNSLPKSPLIEYDALNISIYQYLDVQRITQFMVDNLKQFINHNRPAMRLHLYPICNTTSATVVDNVINTLYQTLKDYLFEYGTIDIEKTLLKKYLEINLETLIYKKTNNSYNPNRY